MKFQPLLTADFFHFFYWPAQPVSHFRGLLGPLSGPRRARLLGLGHRYAEVVYYGLWFTPLREALDAFVAKTQERVTGTVRVKLFKGSCAVVGRKSPFSLYREDFATFGQDDVYDQSDAVGFINLFGLPLKVKALIERENGAPAELEAPDYSIFKRD